MKKINKFVGIFTLLFLLLMPGYAFADAIAYSDVSASHWAYNTITKMTEMKMFSGTATLQDGRRTFSPDKTMTKAEFITVLTRYLYPDDLANMETIAGKEWYYNNYQVAVNKKLFASSELKYESMDEPCSRQEMAMLLKRANRLITGKGAEALVPSQRIADYDTIATVYRNDVLEAYSLGLISGVDDKGTFNPNGSLTRAQATSVLNRLIDPSTRPSVFKGKVVSFKWENGITYKGETVNGEANGWGVMTFPNEGTYSGYFVNGKREGQGKFEWLSGDVYSGNWNRDKMCGQGTYTFPDGYKITGIWSNNKIAASAMYMNPSTVVVNRGEVAKVIAQVEPAQITEKITWTSSNDSVVSVTGKSNMGILSAKKSGTATITAKTESGKQCTASVTVVDTSITKLALNYGDYTLWRGDTVTLRGTVEPTSAPNKTITWSSSNSSVAKVSASGVVTGVSRGNAIIYAKTENGLIATCYVNVY